MPGRDAERHLERAAIRAHRHLSTYCLADRYDAYYAIWSRARHMAELIPLEYQIVTLHGPCL